MTEYSVALEDMIPELSCLHASEALFTEAPKEELFVNHSKRNNAFT